MGDDSRRATRFPYPHRQLIAPVTSRAMPESEQFFEVLFCDLSATGFSFFVAERLNCSLVIAQLGAPPATVPVLARVVHQQRLNGELMYRVGCEILRRMAGPEQRQPLAAEPMAASK